MNGGGVELASYNATYGFGPITATGMAGYDGTDFTTTGVTRNVRISGATASQLFTIPDVGGVGTLGITFENAVNFQAGAATQTLAFADNADILSLKGRHVDDRWRSKPRAHRFLGRQWNHRRRGR
ncbi:MAG: hypothetical protein WDN28_29185 [Chthoniobacter sp.]